MLPVKLAYAWSWHEQFCFDIQNCEDVQDVISVSGHNEMDKHVLAHNCPWDPIPLILSRAWHVWQWPNEIGRGISNSISSLKIALDWKAVGTWLSDTNAHHLLGWNSSTNIGVNFSQYSCFCWASRLWCCARNGGIIKMNSSYPSFILQSTHFSP